MELLSWTIYAIAAPAVVFAGISKGGFGSGVAFASASLLALVIEPGAALGLMLPLLMLIDFSALPAYWRKWDWPSARVLMIGGVPGTFLGAAFYAVSDADAIRLVIGLVSLGFVAWAVSQSLGLIAPPARRAGPLMGLGAGVALGFTSFISHAGGPVAAIYLLGRGLGKTAFQATTVLVFWAMNLLKVGIYATMGIFSRETLILALALAPFAVLGAWMGIRAHRIVSERVFFAIAYTALTLTGGKLVWDALG